MFGISQDFHRSEVKIFYPPPLKFSLTLPSPLDFWTGSCLMLMPMPVDLPYGQLGYPRESVVDDNQIAIPRLPENLANARNDTQGIVDVINGN